MWRCSGSIRQPSRRYRPCQSGARRRSSRPSALDLVVAVVEQVRAVIRAQTAALEQGSPDAMDQLLMYTGYWERCIKDQTAPFCLAGVLAAELPSLPPEIGIAVRVVP